jgi:hypothetical protein
MVKVTWPQVLTWRTRRHFLDRADGGGPVEVAGRLAGVQAQVASATAIDAEPARQPSLTG